MAMSEKCPCQKNVRCGNFVCLCCCRKNVHRKNDCRKNCHRKKVVAPLSWNRSKTVLFFLSIQFAILHICGGGQTKRWHHRPKEKKRSWRHKTEKKNSDWSRSGTSCPDFKMSGIDAIVRCRAEGKSFHFSRGDRTIRLIQTTDLLIIRYHESRLM